MPKGPKVHEDVIRHITTLLANNSGITVPRIEKELINKFAGTDTPLPAIRTIYKIVRKISRLLTYQEEPWSLATMSTQMRDNKEESLYLPREASSFILEAIMDLRNMSKEGEGKYRDHWRYTTEFFKSLDAQPPSWENISASKSLTNRQAKWLWWLHLILPGLKPGDLFHIADAYVSRELYSELFEWEFDTTDLDDGLINILKDVKLHGYYPAKENPEKPKGGE